MKILYFSDYWGWKARSVKRTLRMGIHKRFPDMIYYDTSRVKYVKELVQKHKPDQIWLVHTGLKLPCDKDILGVPVIGFGFSDSHYFSEDILKSYTVYATCFHDLYLKYKDQMPVYYFPILCDTDFYHNLRVKRDIDISHVGQAMHPGFKNKWERLDVINRLRGDTGLGIHAYGGEWPAHPLNSGRIEAEEYLNVINRSKLGLDIQDAVYTPTQRLYDYAACGTPVITLWGEQLCKLLEDDKEILTYKDYDELREKLVYYTEHPKLLRKIGMAAKRRCVKDYNADLQIDALLSAIERLL